MEQFLNAINTDICFAIVATISELVHVLFSGSVIVFVCVLAAVAMLDLWKLYWVVTGRDVSSPITPGLDRPLAKEDTLLVGVDHDEERDDKTSGVGY